MDTKQRDIELSDELAQCLESIISVVETYETNTELNEGLKEWKERSRKALNSYYLRTIYLNRAGEN